MLNVQCVLLINWPKMLTFWANLKKSLGFQKVVQMMKICPIWSHWIYKTSYEQRVSKNVDIFGLIFQKNNSDLNFITLFGSTNVLATFFLKFGEFLLRTFGHTGYF